FNTQSFVVVDLHQFVIPATGTRLLLSRTSYPETGPQIRATRPEAFNTCQGPAFPIVHQSKCLSRPICRRSTPGFSINTHFARNRLVLFKMYAGQSDFSNGGFARYFHRYSTDTGQHAGLYKTCEYEHLENWQKPGANPGLERIKPEITTSSCRRRFLHNRRRQHRRLKPSLRYRRQHRFQQPERLHTWPDRASWKLRRASGSWP